MIMRFVFGIILLLFSCKESLVLPPDDKSPIDTDPPQIKWMYPRFDAVVNEMLAVICQVTDKSSINTVELWADNVQTDIINISFVDSIYTLNWPITNYNNGDEPLLFIKAIDNKGNDTISQKIRVIIDANHVYPEPVVLYPLDSLFIDSVFSGYTVTWWYSGDQYFKKYILERSDNPFIIESIEIFTTENKSTIKYDDQVIYEEGVIYYRVVVEDIFGKQTAGNVVSTLRTDMPPQWNIQTVQYTTDSIFVRWDNPAYNQYLSHKILYADKRDGNFDTLDIYSDSLQNQYKNVYLPFPENWFSILTEDSLGQKSVSEPYMHPPPQEPQIDSVSYSNNSFRLQWGIEPEIDFINYRIMSTELEDAFALSEIQQIINQAEDTLHFSINESQYYLFQIITTDVWDLETRGPIIMTSSFYKFSIKEDNGLNDLLYSVITNDEGKYIAVGESNQSESWFLQVNGNGKIEVSKNFGESNSKFNSITHAVDGNYLVAGSKDNNLIVKKIDINGNVIWTNDYEFESPDVGNAIISLSDEAIGVTGYSHINFINQDVLVMKIDIDDGSAIWSTNIGGNERDEGHDILPSDNGGMYILCETHSQGNYDGDIWIIEINSNGNIVDTLLISIPGKQIGYSFTRLDNGTFTIVGETSGSSGVTDAFLIQVDESGEVIWTFSYGGSYNDIGYSLVYSDGGWVLAGQTYSYDMGGGDAWLVKVSESGDFEWMQTFGDINNDIAYDIQIANDGGYIICGSTYIPGNQRDGWLIKTDSRGNFKEILSYP